MSQLLDPVYAGENIVDAVLWRFSINRTGKSAYEMRQIDSVSAASRQTVCIACAPGAAGHAP